MTGAGSGLGRAFAEMLAGEGLAVWATARDPSRLAPLRKAGRVTPVALELAEPDAAVAALRAAEQSAGTPIDLLVNNAGYGIFGEFGEIGAEEWSAQVSRMLGTSLRLCHAAWTAWSAEQAGGGRGRPRGLVNVSSLAVDFPLPFMSGYNAAKAGLSALSESLLQEGRRRRFRVIDFRPGDYRTGFNRAMRLGKGPAGPLAPVWAALERHLEGAPPPERAAADLRRALLAGRSGTVRSGGFFQARLAPLLTRFSPQAWQRAVSARYFGVR